MKHLIGSVDKGSPADDIKISGGTYLLSINGEEVADIIDYEQLTCEEKLTVVFELPNGEILEEDIEKDMYTPLGLNFESSLMSPMRACKNHCIFCFIDQMPHGGRQTLHFKDDDWRLSLIMGNYVTLTNVDDAEFNRIIRRRVSPLYISVHATDGEVRKCMMRNPTAPLIMERLSKLRDAGLMFHAQVVLCPGINDGAVLEKTIRDLFSLRPAAQSVAVVPVGLTRYREGLYPLRTQTCEEALSTIEVIHKLQDEFLQQDETRFVFAADEMYVKANMPIPPERCYEDYPQIENGVGLLRMFEADFLYALESTHREIRRRLRNKRITVHGVTGESAYPFLSELFKKAADVGIDFVLHPIHNDFFGDTVTVAGLVCAEDIAAQLRGEKVDFLIVPRVMLRENDDVFLDGKSVSELSEMLSCRVYPVDCHNGEDFLYSLTDILEKEIL
ncbi:MAG: DUF512 domain-containing protein [Clostridia bacterium]|nr:DUF512 domain-containing protein [Clostridia bacterium]